MNKKMQIGTTVQICAMVLAALLLSLVIIVPWNIKNVDAQNELFVITDERTIVVVMLVTFGIGIALIRYLTKKQFWQFFFALAAFAGMFTVFSRLLLILVGNEWMRMGSAGAVTIAFLVLRARYRFVAIHNAIVLCTVAGLAQLFGTQLAPVSMLAALLFLTFYDVVAHRYSPTVATTMQQLIARDAFIGFIIPQRLHQWRSTLHDVQETSFRIGAGDVAFPLFFVVTLLWTAGVYAFLVGAIALLVAGGLLVPLATSMPKRGVPALLPFTLMCLLAYAVLLQFSLV